MHRNPGAGLTQTLTVVRRTGNRGGKEDKEDWAGSAV
jgi:hypothetical protein